MFTRVKDVLIKKLQELNSLPVDTLLAQRYEKYRTIGFYTETSLAAESSQA
jgi:acetyl-CoA carboxylase alpha subunit